MVKSQKINDLKKKFLLSEVEYQIISELIRNPRKTLSKIAETLNKNRATITKKFNKLLNDGIIKISINLNLNYLKNDFYLLRINIKSLDYASELFEFLKKCPKIIYISHSFIDNSFLVILCDENHEALKHKYFSCMHLIEQIQENPKIEDCHFETLLNPILPNYLTLDKLVLNRRAEKSPCKKDCTLCINYLETCTGCPSTIHYKGELNLSI
ncbi:MAG: winged helix-turn-helix transcriptional regulator [Promethearchaeota archaeon]